MNALKVGSTVVAKEDLTNSSGSIVRAKKGEKLKVVALPPLPGFVVVVGRKGEFCTTFDDLESFVEEHRPKFRRRP